MQYRVTLQQQLSISMKAEEMWRFFTCCCRTKYEKLTEKAWYPRCFFSRDLGSILEGDGMFLDHLILLTSPSFFSPRLRFRYIHVLQPRGSGLYLGYPDPMLKEEIKEGEDEERHTHESARAQQITDELKELMREMKQDMQDLRKTTGELSGKIVDLHEHVETFMQEA